MVAIYGQTHLINLVNHKGHELPIKDAFERSISQVMSSDPNLARSAHYLYFDFHTECKNMRFDRISVLIDRLAPALQDMGWYHSTSPSIGAETTVLARQSGVTRSNCMDCLDRTNVSQSALGKWALDKQLRAAGVLSVKESVNDHEEFMSILRNGQLVGL